MPTVMAAEGPILDRVLNATCRSVRIGLDRDACGKFHRARLKTAWGAGHQRAFALVDGDNILAAAERYDLPGVLDGAAVRVCAVGSLWTGPAQPDGVHARTLIDAVLADAERDGAQMALLFPSANIADEVGRAFDAMPMTDLTLSVTESSRHGAPMTMVRGGEERDFAAMVAMGRVRADQLRFHLDRDNDFIQYVITTRRLLAGLGSAHARQLHFFIAEEGITAAAYVIVSVVGESWTLEECGDRDASGARVGALLQALIAREPVERRPTIRAWLPPGFLPPRRSPWHLPYLRPRPSGCVCSARARLRRRCPPPTCCSGTTICSDVGNYRLRRALGAIYPCDPSTLAPSASAAIAVSSSGSPSASKPGAFVVVLGKPSYRALLDVMIRDITAALVVGASAFRLTVLMI